MGGTKRLWTCAYENEFDKIYTINAVDKFVEKDGEWVGDVELLKPYVKEYIDEFTDDLKKNEGKSKERIWLNIILSWTEDIYLK